MSQRMVLNTVIKEKRSHVWGDRVVSAISWDAYAAATNNPYYLTGLSWQRTISIPIPVYLQLAAALFHIFISGPKRKQKLLSGHGATEKEAWRHATGLTAFAHIASHFTGQSKSDSQARWPWDRQDDPPSVGTGSAGEGSRYCEIMRPGTLFFVCLETYQKSQTEVQLFSWRVSVEEKNLVS